MFKKILVANRGEIAIRAMRAAVELGARTVAVFPYEDRNSVHRLKADEAYQIGEEGHPVRAYLDVSEIIRVAKESGADAIYPGYGFLSENPDLARAAAEAGITFIGPPTRVLEMAGNKVTAKEHAIAAGVPVLKSTPASTDLDELIAGANEIGFPVFAKAVAGGGGRGMRRVEKKEDLRGALEEAMREADSAFGDPTMFVEQAVVRPRHIEVQILADAHGGTIHLFERDCSVQRRHQKVVEIAPAPNLDEDTRQAMYRDAIAFAKSIDYVNAGTVEFLLDTAGERKGEHVFIEMNPRIQVEHTVTEEVTDVDLVQSQMRIAFGESLDELGLRQDELKLRGAALQCRITTEDPASGFRPDTGKITTYRSPGGAGIRLDGGTVSAGSQISPHFDSMLVKMTCRGRDFASAVRRARRGLAEFRLRGVTTNIPFLQGVLDDPEFIAGDLSTAFIDERPWLVNSHRSKDRGTKILTWLADVTVNQPNGDGAGIISPQLKLPEVDLSVEAPAGSRQRLLELGPAGFASALREQKSLAVTETTFRDAHQSLLATRVRTRDLVAVMPHVARMTPELLSVEAWGGATYDVALRFLAEDPWERLASMREALPNVAIQMLLRGRNTVGYTPYPTEVTDAFVREAADTGVDIFRIFDALNDVSQMRPAIDAVLNTGTAVAEVALCYTGDLLDPNEDLYTLDYYLTLADQIMESGAHVLAIKDMAGLLRAEAAEKLVTALRERFDAPVHVHTHDTAGGQLATLLAASRAGADAVDVASAPMAGTTSQPSMSALVAALAHTERDTGISLDAVSDLEPYWEAVRHAYAPFESGLPGPTGRVYHHEIPGGQLSNLRQQAIALGLADQFETIENLYAAANKMLGRPPKVTPSSKVVGDLALALAAAHADPADFEENPDKYDIPDSVIGFMAGELGELPGGWPEPFRSKVLKGRNVKIGIEEISADDQAALDGEPQERRSALNRLLFAGPTQIFETARETYGDLSALDSKDYLYGIQQGHEHVVEIEKGVQLFVGLEAIGEADEKGMRTVMATLNGQLRPVFIRDQSIKVDSTAAEKADASKPGHVAAPFSGVVTLQVEEGATVAVGDTVASIEAMKMEAAITASVAGTVKRLAIPKTQQVDGGDLLVEIEPS
ncbi:pyruvate carboxylase [Salinibacterium sp. NSLL150]|uniref:pyruvate carboxylase n=1 Tax=unclassified Salinibacterium TaxID=2632331 RepID=UPI0018CF73B3|nr:MULTISPECIES: pyruvate carboxylase [unclassified Salinibacterium]MBH0024304.1 pyruvate carboxylase [Salinibacterium sp. SWN248]MBH0099272.1 pyruvate carboxylase [Salinibacterium sp. NSLL35]MBH0102026.1 pyruvate carboxylase [Salinibacterium sp. NSLL150]MBH0104786.1 pyruvate carboxylase [Salinibacterium sp. NSLL16]MBH0107546.1 pyruvate carboxylase [Salinibacterium sp. NSLL17]